jgi:hypothetical protein
MKVISLGVGRTGTYSLKLALEKLGFGPCHHMEEVMKNAPTQVPLWAKAAAGHADWRAMYAGYNSATDWPTAAFARELPVQYPNAKFILTVRSPETWAASFLATIYKFCAERHNVRPELQSWIDMVYAVIYRTGFPDGLDEAGLAKAFTAHNEAVKAMFPAGKLLVFQVKEGWGPLCEYLGVPVPDEPFPRTNDRGEFWDLAGQALLPA